MTRALIIFIAFVTALCLTFLVAGCAHTTMTETQHVDTTTITWLDQPTGRLCSGPGIVSGCAYTSQDYSRCVVVMPKSSPDWLIAHEMRHCFGFSH